MQAEVIAFQDECTRDLAAAEPIIKEAEAALNSLDKGSLGELKSFGSPAAEVVQVVSACMVLTAPGGKIPKVQLLPEVNLLKEMGSLLYVQQPNACFIMTVYLLYTAVMGPWRFTDCIMMTCCCLQMQPLANPTMRFKAERLLATAVCRTSVGMPARNSWAMWTPS